MNITLIGIDLAKSIFQVCGVNQAGKQLFNRQVRRNKLIQELLRYPNATIAMEACSGSNYWGRELIPLGYEVMLIPPQHVKPFVKGNKNDRNDAFAITEAARRPGLQCVQPRSLEQTDMALLHRLRERRTNARTTLINQMRGMLWEYGLVFPQGKKHLRAHLSDILDDASNGLTEQARQFVRSILLEWGQLDEQIADCDKQIRHKAQANEATIRLMTIRGVGEQIATAAVAHIGNGNQFKSARHCAANLGLVPKEHSSGGIQKNGGITKRGNRYLRWLLVQGAWSILIRAKQRDDTLSKWADSVCQRRGKQKAVVAIANKLARIIWALLHHQTAFNPNHQATLN